MEVGGEDAEVDADEKVPFEERVSPVAFHSDGVESVVPFEVLADEDAESEAELDGPTLRLTVTPCGFPSPEFPPSAVVVLNLRIPPPPPPIFFVSLSPPCFIDGLEFDEDVSPNALEIESVRSY